MVRTRTAAATLVEDGHVRLNGERISAASRPVKAGDVATIALDRTIRILKVTGFAERRGDAEAARVLFDDLTPVPVPKAAAEPAGVERDAGSGRPTKQERRATDRLLGRD